MTTEAQREASRINGARSKGPKTPEGKAVSRFNGLKHGLRAEQVVLPGEDPAEFEAERRGWLDDWKPQSHTRAVLCERAAAASWRLRRSVRAEAATLAKAAAEAARAVDEDKVARFDRARARFGDDPSGALWTLGLMAEGLDLLIERWAGLAALLEGGASVWTGSELHHGRLMLLLGRFYEDDPAAVTNPAAAASARLAAANAPGGKRKPAAAEVEADLACLRAKIAEALADLRARRAAMTEPAVERQRAIDAASCDASKEAQLRHRYEMAHERSLRATIGQLAALAKSGLDLGGGEAETYDTEWDKTKRSGLASDPEPPAPGSLGAVCMPEAATPAPALPGPSNRDRGGRTWPEKGSGGGK